STMITKAATTTNCTIILIFGGIMFRIRELTTLPMATTNMTERAITMEAFNCAVMARAEQIPNTCTVIGLLSNRGSFTRLASFFDNSAIILIFSSDCFQIWSVQFDRIVDHRRNSVTGNSGSCQGIYPVILLSFI